MKEKTKVTLYINPEMHHQLKVKAVLEKESMSDIVQRVVSLYLQYPDKMEQIEDEIHGNTYQVHLCPVCATSLILKNGQLNSLENHPMVEDDVDLEIPMISKVLLEESTLIPC